MKLRVGVIGASGYVGGELLRLLLLHPEVEVACATSRQHAGEYIHRVHPNLRGITSLQFSHQDSRQLTGSCDLVFTCVPHGKAVEMVPKFVEVGLKVIDLSADFRLKDPDDYAEWYGYQHPYPDLLQKSVYGIPELHREEIRNSRLIACPGCMAVTSILPLAPLVKSNMIERERIIIDAKIGSSGAGGRPTAATHHAERFGVVRPYKPVGHRHTAEIEQELSLLAGDRVMVSMSSHAVNMVRGILCTSHTFMRSSLTLQDVWKAYRDLFGQEPFIRLVRDRKGIYRYPDPKVVVGSNFCDIGFEMDRHSNRLVVMSSTDNLIKGAAGSAVQCMNVMLGLDERTGLMSPALHPV